MRGRRRVVRASEAEPYPVDRKAETVGGDLGHRRIGAGPHVAGGCLDFRRAVAEQADAGARRRLEGGVGSRRRAHADQQAAVAHRTRFRRPAGPAELPGGQVVALRQRAAGERLVLALVNLRFVAAAKLDRVDAERIGQFVHRRFQREHAARLPRPAHVVRGCRVEFGQAVLCPDVRTGINVAGNRGERLGKLLIATRFAGTLVQDGGQPAIRAGAESHPLKGARPVPVVKNICRRVSTSFTGRPVWAPRALPASHAARSSGSFRSRRRRTGR